MFNEILELQKGTGGLSEGFAKSSGFHKAMAECHDGMSKAHSDHHAVVKAHHEAMDDGDVHKAYFGKVADHHKAMAEHHAKAAQGHKDEAERLDAASKAMHDPAALIPAPAPAPNKAAGTVEGASQGVDTMINSAVEKITSEALKTLETSPAVKDAIERAVVERVNAALGNKIMPDGARLTPPSDDPVIKLMPRPGQEIPVEGLDPALADFVGA